MFQIYIYKKTVVVMLFTMNTSIIGHRRPKMLKSLVISIFSPFQVRFENCNSKNKFSKFWMKLIFSVKSFFIFVALHNPGTVIVEIKMQSSHFAQEIIRFLCEWNGKVWKKKKNLTGNNPFAARKSRIVFGKKWMEEEDKRSQLSVLPQKC